MNDIQTTVTPAAIHGRSPWRAAWNSLRLVMQDSFAVVGVAILILFILIALTAPLLAPFDPFKAMMTETGRLARLRPPSAEYLLGTTAFGNDVLKIGRAHV